MGDRTFSYGVIISGWDVLNDNALTLDTGLW